MQVWRRWKRRSRIDLVRVELVDKCLGQEHVLMRNNRAKAVTGHEATLFKGLFTKFYLREMP